MKQVCGESSLSEIIASENFCLLKTKNIQVFI